MSYVLSPAQDAALGCGALMDAAEQGSNVEAWRIGARHTTLTSLCKAGFLTALDSDNSPLDLDAARYASRYQLTGKGRAIALGKAIALYQRRIDKLIALKVSLWVPA